MADMQDRFIETLFNTVREVQYPSVEILDRIESNIATPEQLQEYLDILFEHVESTQYPSRDLLDRLERLSHLAPTPSGDSASATEDAASTRG